MKFWIVFFILSPHSLAWSSDHSDGGSVIDGDVNIKASVKNISTTATDQEGQETSNAQICIGTIGNNVRITGNVSIKVSGVTGDNRCNDEIKK